MTRNDDERAAGREDDAPAGPGLRVVAPGEWAPPWEQAVWELLDLRTTKRGDEKITYPAPVAHNVTTILSRDSRWVGRIRHNEFSGDDEIGTPTREIAKVSDVASTEVVEWLGRTYGLHTTEDRVDRSIALIASCNAYHPVREYLDGLKWDGTHRIERLFPRYFGVGDSELTRAYGRCFLVGAVARAMAPGCKVDTVPVLVGHQGDAKGQAIAALVPVAGWCSGSVMQLGDKDLYGQIAGRWIYEVQEIDRLRHVEAGLLKSIISTQVDAYRRPYGRHTISVPRQVALIGTSNVRSWISDPTGSRRFWPMTLERETDVAAIERDRDQLWAEARHRYGDHLWWVREHGGPGSPYQWWLTDELEAVRRAESDDYAVLDAWQDAIAEYLAGKTFTTLAEVLRSAVGKPLDQQSPGDLHRARDCLTRLGWEAGRATGGADRNRRGWVPDRRVRRK